MHTHTHTSTYRVSVKQSTTSYAHETCFLNVLIKRDDKVRQLNPAQNRRPKGLQKYTNLTKTMLIENRRGGQSIETRVERVIVNKQKENLCHLSHSGQTTNDPLMWLSPAPNWIPNCSRATSTAVVQCTAI